MSFQFDIAEPQFTSVLSNREVKCNSPKKSSTNNKIIF